MNKIFLLPVLLASILFTGCVPAVRGAREHKVHVVDAERGRPVSGATIDLHYYPHAPEAPDPDHPRATTDGQGEVVIRTQAKPVIWQVQAEGYIEQRLSSNEGTLPPRYTAHATDAYDGVIHLYQKPEPRLTIRVGDTYTGPLTIHLEPAPGFGFVPLDEINVAFAAVDPQASYVQGAVGQRVFTETASANGTVRLTVTPLLYGIEEEHLEVRDSSGVLPHRDIANPEDVERGVWGSVTDDEKRLHHWIRVFVGTLEDYKRALSE